MLIQAYMTGMKQDVVSLRFVRIGFPVLLHVKCSHHDVSCWLSRLSLEVVSHCSQSNNLWARIELPGMLASPRQKL